MEDAVTLSVAAQQSSDGEDIPAMCWCQHEGLLWSAATSLISRGNVSVGGMEPAAVRHCTGGLDRFVFTPVIRKAEQAFAALKAR